MSSLPDPNLAVPIFETVQSCGQESIRKTVHADTKNYSVKKFTPCSVNEIDFNEENYLIKHASWKTTDITRNHRKIYLGNEQMDLVVPCNVAVFVINFNKKVLLCEHNRRTARGISCPWLVLSRGYTLSWSWPRGYPCPGLAGVVPLSWS